MSITPTAVVISETVLPAAEPVLKNHLHPTDLTDAGFGLAIEAAQQAQSAGARLILLHSLTPVTDEGEAAEVTERMAQEKLDTLAGMLHQLFGLSITRLLTHHLSESEVRSLAEQLNAEVVVRKR